MLKNSFKTTSILALCTALAAPPGFAQTKAEA